MKRRGLVVTAVITGLALVAGMIGFIGNKATKSEAASNSLLAYTNAVGKIGTCINSHQLRDSNTLNGLKKHYNSITLENENKPDSILGGSPKLISVDQAKKQGYFIPSNYRESNVPQLNFGTVDEVLRICTQNKLSYRAHTLVWHAQTPAWWFRQGYNGGAGFVNQAQMDARLEFYIKSVMNHVYNNPNGKCCYAWDVANEYIHAANSGWLNIYGNVTTQSQLMKKAFTFAKQVVNSRKLSNSVKLFYNDYNTYMEQDKIVSLVNYINGSGKVCDGVGMQSHLSTNFPSVDYYMSALNKFAKQGYEIQITELDCKGNGDTDQANYMYNLMKNVLQAKKNGAKITGITYWGMYDSVSWRGGDNPLLFKNSISTPKQSYYKVIQAYDDVYGNMPNNTNNNTNKNNTNNTNKNNNNTNKNNTNKNNTNTNKNNKNNNTGTKTTIVNGATHVECENMKVSGKYAAKISKPFKGVILYANKDACSYTQYFANKKHTFSLRGCTTTNKTAKVGLKVDGKYVGTFSFKSKKPTISRIKNISHKTGFRKVELILKDDINTWDADIDYLEIKR